jgi:hypothetical protein
MVKNFVLRALIRKLNRRRVLVRHVVPLERAPQRLERSTCVPSRWSFGWRDPYETKKVADSWLCWRSRLEWYFDSTQFFLKTILARRKSVLEPPSLLRIDGFSNETVEEGYLQLRVDFILPTSLLALIGCRPTITQRDHLQTPFSFLFQYSLRFFYLVVFTSELWMIITVHWLFPPPK